MEQDRGAEPQNNSRHKSLGRRWAEYRPTKTILFWSCVTTAVLTMLIGFRWGGWMTGGSAQSMSETMSGEAVVTRLAPLCVAQFLLDPAKAEKLVELKAMSMWARGDYIMKQGWATISGDKKPDRKVAAECAELLALIPEIAPSPSTDAAAETMPPSE